jgi:hypothetical protein
VKPPLTKPSVLNELCGVRSPIGGGILAPSSRREAPTTSPFDWMHGAHARAGLLVVNPPLQQGGKALPCRPAESEGLNAFDEVLPEDLTIGCSAESHTRKPKLHDPWGFLANIANRLIPSSTSPPGGVNERLLSHLALKPGGTKSGEWYLAAGWRDRRVLGRTLVGISWG